MATTNIRSALGLLERYAEDHPSGISVNERNLIHAARAESDNADAAIVALEALTNPEGHIWHGAHSDECTGECKAVRAVLADAKVSP